MVNYVLMAKAIEDDIIHWRRKLHACPELRMNTSQTESIIYQELAKMGITDIKSGVGGHGVSAIIYGSHPGKCLGIRVDCDGLPIVEETGLPFASKNGNMHACGHDAHTAIGLGVARLLNENRDKLKGCVKLIFQPYEEGDGGAKAMIGDGVMERPRVDAIIGIHLAADLDPKTFNNGDIICTSRPCSANIYAFKATFYGKSSHVSTPHLGIDPIYMACSATIQLQELMSRERNPNDNAILSVSTIHGGVRNNIIPDNCYIEGSIRSFDKEAHNYYIKRTKEICEMIAKSLRGAVEFETNIDLMCTKIDQEMYNKFMEIIPKIVPAEQVKELWPIAPGGEDFARFAELVPAMHFRICSRPKNGPFYPHHHPKFDIDEDTLHLGTAVLAGFALEWQIYLVTPEKVPF